MTPELNSAISKAAEEKYPEHFRYNKDKQARSNMVTGHYRDAYTAGATEALTNPDLYEKAWLVKREDAKQEAIAFAEWLKNNAHNWENEWHIWNKENKRYDTYKTTKKLYQLFKQQV